jgi:DNA methylase
VTAARLLIGDVFERMAELEDGSMDLILTSPPFLALRSYLPEGHPDKAKEIGYEPTPAAFLDTMLALTAEWRRLLAPHGSIAIEIGDTYSGSGGAGGDYGPDGLRDGQGKFAGSATQGRRSRAQDEALGILTPRPRPGPGQRDEMPGWPMAKSLALIPELYAASLAYGRNLLRVPPSARELIDWCDQIVVDCPGLPAVNLLGMMHAWLDQHTELGPTIEYDRWRVRNIKPWIRSNPPVGALGDKERPATSYVTVATIAVDRYFDLDAVRTPFTGPSRFIENDYPDRNRKGVDATESARGGMNERKNTHAGAPPLDWWHHTDAVIDAEIERMRAQRPNGPQGPQKPNPKALAAPDDVRAQSEMGHNRGTGARGVHIRRALETAGILTTHDALDISPRGYAGAHYAVWPKELVKLLVDEMCPRKVCTTCGQPERRTTMPGAAIGGREVRVPTGYKPCGHGTWRPGHILDPFAGSGTTLAVATGMARTATGIDLDTRNADLARERVGMFLDIDEGTSQAAS